MSSKTSCTVVIITSFGGLNPEVVTVPHIPTNPSQKFLVTFITDRFQLQLSHNQDDSCFETLQTMPHSK